MLLDRKFRGLLASTIVVSLALVGCGGTARDAVRVAAPTPSTLSPATDSSTSVPSGAVTPDVLNSQVVLNNEYVLAPPSPTDVASLTTAQASATFEAINPASGLTSGPFVFLARYTDLGLLKADAFLGQANPYPADAPDNKLVVAVLAYGTSAIQPVGPSGQTSPTSPPAETILWTYDPVTGHPLWGANFPGRLPTISASPAP